MLFAEDLSRSGSDSLTDDFLFVFGGEGLDERTREFADDIVTGTLKNLQTIDDRIRTRAEHWRIERMAIVDRNVLRLAVYEFLYKDTPPGCYTEAMECPQVSTSKRPFY